MNMFGPKMNIPHKAYTAKKDDKSLKNKIL